MYVGTHNIFFTPLVIINSDDVPTMSDHVDVVKKYRDYRREGDVDGALALCNADIVVQSERDGTHEGKEAVRAYMEKVKPSGEWQEPCALDSGRVYVQGKVEAFRMLWDVVGLFDFDGDDRIEKIKLVRGTISK